MRRRVAALTAALVASAGLLAGCSGDAPRETSQQTPAPDPTGTADPADPTGAADAAARAEEGYSTPVEDAVYPEVGDPGVDALHYALTLTWDPDARHLDARELLTFRATEDAPRFRLDLAAPLTVGSVRVDGEDAAFEHAGKDLVVARPVTEDAEYAVRLRYSGTPEPVPAPVQRSDFSTTGWTTTRDGGVWTMQEPFGAYSWYAVNDQPSDKARYDITVRVPAPMVGVANGELRSRRTVDGLTVSRWRLEDPAASYLVTVGIGRFEETTDESSSGVPISYWVERGRAGLVRRLGAAPAGLDWLEERLGPYPFDTLGFLVVDSRSGMETQTMITLGDTRYATSPEVLVHEMAHHWYGDLVTPLDWGDLWMNEGMATFLQGVWTGEHTGRTVEQVFAEWADYGPRLRADHGPPAAYDEDAFGSGNAYYIPAVMWNELRLDLGDDLFWRLVREWPAAHAHANADYEAITTWWSEESGRDLSGFFERWLLAEEPPAATGSAEG